MTKPVVESMDNLQSMLTKILIKYAIWSEKVDPDDEGFVSNANCTLAYLEMVDDYMSDNGITFNESVE